LNVNVANFFGMIANIDENVGQLRKLLAELGLTENTIFIFTTDNGTSSGDRVFNAGMRGKKGSEFDGGHRVPFFVYWPQGKLTGPRDVQPIAAHVDVLPTLIDLCGIAAPAGVKFDGVSLRPLLAEAGAPDWPDRILVTDSQRVKDPIKWRKSAVMTSQWRLINGEQLYDIRRDPGQRSDVAGEHPQVLARLRQFYESWWTELEPTFQQDVAIYLGHPRDNPARLTSHDWITTRSTPWNQAQIRAAMTGKPNTGFWNVQVVEDGAYEIRLRRWPEEADLPIDAPLAPGAAVPGARAFRSTPGKAVKAVTARLRIGPRQLQSDVAAGAKEVVFEVDLKAGRTRMEAVFSDADGRQYGAYYAYVRKR
jgi:arylsulfatase B